jgi:beta-1,2-mannobiose phosphorylase / 1,2-beta-oligomannan phosphorylase
MLVLDMRDPRRVVYRSPDPILAPETPDEIAGPGPSAVFPTGVDDRGHGRLDVYYGMADTRIGAACLQIPTQLSVATPS